MKNPKQKLKNILLLVTVLFAFSCSEDLFENRVHHHDEDKNEISFKQFKNETGINKFDYLKKAGISKSTDFQARTIESEFITDTIGIKKYVNPTNNKTTYSFKIYPLSEDLNAKEYYNLVYEKVGTEWNEIIFFNTEKANPTDARTLESSEMVYNRISGREGFSEVITYSFHCTGCTGPCDICNKCVSTHVSYIYTGIQDSGSGNNGIPTGTGNNNNGNSGGGSDEYSGIFIPNSYDGDVDLNNPDFIFAGQVVAYTSSLPSNLRDVMSNNFWLFYDIKEFFKNNGGLTKANKDAVVYALSNIEAIFTTISQNSNDLTTVQINQTKQSAFQFLLQHGAWLAGQSATTQQSILQNLTSLEKIEKMDELTDYITLNPSVSYAQYVNWFSLELPGIESLGAYDSTFWDNPNLNFPQQQLPSYATFIQNFPGQSVNAQQLCTNISGEILTLYNNIINSGNNINTCAIRLSKALNDSGIIIPYIPGKTKAGVSNGSNTKYYFTFAADLNKWMIKTFGTNSNLGLGPTNNNHVRIYYSHLSEFIDPINGNVLSPNNPLTNLQGIFSMVSSNPYWSTGHCDILQSNTTCINNCHFEGPIQYIDIWKLN